ncbi:MAG TPA: thioredoxin domain-containing protein [Syntrophorhabdaceae bacterium]|jgi:thiol:disulfide interchange protein DsbA
MSSVLVWLIGKRYIINVILALLAVSIEVFYSICGGSCSYLKGEVFGMGLQYIGIAYMAFIIFLSITKKDRLLILVLSAGVAVEVYLVGFHVWYDTYCPYCLAFGGTLMVMFLLNIRKDRLKPALLSGVIALALFSFFFKGSATPVYAAETLVPSFGSGKVMVRLYTDYFCPPCRGAEPKIEPLIAELVKKNIINLTFVDTPLYKASPLYGRYFVYILNEKKDLDLALKARSVLMDAAREDIGDQSKLEEYLTNKGIKFTPFDAKQTFNVINGYLKEDKIISTPSCVVVQDGKAAKYTGGTDIVNALEGLKQAAKKKP